MSTLLGDFIRKEREARGIGSRELCELTASLRGRSGRGISSGYLSQVETGYADMEKVSMDVLWAIGVALEIDPLKLFVLSRPHIDQRYLASGERRRLFREGDGRT